MGVCWVILRGQQIYTVIQAVQSLHYIVAKCHFFSVVTWKDIIKYLQKCEGCTDFCEILYIAEFYKQLLGTRQVQQGGEGDENILGWVYTIRE